MPMTAIDGAVCALGQQARGVQNDALALLTKAPQNSSVCGASVPLEGFNIALSGDISRIKCSY